MAPPLKVDGPTRQQPLFNRMVAAAGCNSAVDKISYLRDAPYPAIYGSVQNERKNVIVLRHEASTHNVQLISLDTNVRHPHGLSDVMATSSPLAHTLSSPKAGLLTSRS
jgi:hypothetical protein